MYPKFILTLLMLFLGLTGSFVNGQRTGLNQATTLSSQSSDNTRNQNVLSNQKKLESSNSASPFDAVKGKKEDRSKRDAYSKHYINEDGSFTALIGAGPIHYEKNGQFLDIDYKIRANSDANYPFANTSNLFESYFGATAHTGVKNKTVEGEIREFLNTQMYWEVNGQALNTLNSTNATVSIDEDKAYYHNLYGNISAEFITLTGKRKLNYIIPTKQDLGSVPAGADYLVFTEDVVLPSGWTSITTERGIIVKDASGKEIYLYENPVSTDESTQGLREENTIFETALNGNVLTIKTKVKTEWLLSSERVFPIKVDPTVTVYPTGSDYNTGSVDNFGTGNKTADADMYIGMRPAYGMSSGTRRFFRSWASFNLTAIPAGSSINSARLGFYIGLNSLNSSYGEYVRIGPIDSHIPNQVDGTTLYNLCGEFGTEANHWLSINPGGTGNVSVDFDPTQINYIESRLVSGIFSLGFAPEGSYDIGYTEQVGIYGSNRPQQTLNGRPYIIINYTIPDLTCSTLNNLTSSLGTPANGLDHMLRLDWDALSGATSYDVQFSTDGTNYSNATPSNVPNNYADISAGDNPNLRIWFRVRGKNATETCDWTYTSPIYTAADVPEIPVLSNTTSTSLDLLLPAETPVENPAITEYSIYCTTTNQFVQADGTLGATEVWQTKSDWNTITVIGLTTGEYCFYAKARNGDGHIVGGGTTFLTQTFDSDVLTHGTSAGTNTWFAPNSKTPIAWGATSGCSSGGGVGYSGNWNNFWGNFLRLPAQDLTGKDEVTMTFDLSNSLDAGDENFFRFYIHDGTDYHNPPTTVKIGSNTYTQQGINNSFYIFDEARTCETVTVTYDISSITNKSSLLFYIEANSRYDNSNPFHVYFDNITLLDAPETACITLSVAPIPIFHNYGGTDQLAFNNSRIDTDAPVFRLSHPTTSAATVYQLQVSPNPDFSGSPIVQDFSGTFPANTEANFNFTNTSGLLTNNTTYYVRARIDIGSGYGNWTTDTYSFTYQTPKATPDWFQTTQAQFLTDELSGVEANTSHDVVVQSGGGGGNPFQNPSFETSSNWNTFKTGGSELNVVVSDGNNWSSQGSKAARMYMYGGYAFSSDVAIVSQVVDLTDIEQIVFDAQSHYGPNMFSSLSNGGTLRLIIGGTTSNTAGTVYATVNHCVSGSSTCSVQSLNVTANIPPAARIPNQLVKFVWTGFSQGDLGGALVSFMVDNVRAEAPSSGTITSTPIHLASVQGATSYTGIIWNQTLGGGDLTLKVQGSATPNGTYTDIPGYTNITQTGDGEKTHDISGINAITYPHIRLVGTLNGANVVLHDWAINFVAPTLIADFTPSSLEICEGEEITFTDNSTGSVTSWQWDFPGGDNTSATTQGPHTVTFNTAGTYNIKLTVGDGANTDDQEIEITVNAKPTVDITEKVSADPLALCEGSTLTLNATGGSTYSWTGPNGFTNAAASISLPNITLAGSGWYVVEVSDGACSEKDSIEVTVTDPSIFTETIPVTACKEFTWDKNGTNYTASGNYTYIEPGVALNGCDSTYVLDLTINDEPTVSITGDNTLCEDNTLSLTATGGTTYSWTGPDGFTNAAASISLPNITLAGSGWYVVEVSDGACSAKDSIEVTVTDPSTFTKTVSVTACKDFTWDKTGTNYTTSGTYNYVEPGVALNGCDSTYVLDLTISNTTLTSTHTAVACDSYTWVDGNTYTSSTNTPTFTYTSIGGCDSIVTLDLTIHTLESINIVSQGSLCEGTTLYLDAGGNPGASYAWTGPNGFTSQVRSPQISSLQNGNAGEYKVVVSKGGVCTDSATIMIDVLPLPVVDYQVVNDSCTSGTGSITINATSPNGALTYLWNNGNATNHLANLEEGVYEVTVYDAAQCAVSTEILVDDEMGGCDCFVYVANAFSPNGDKNNDELFVQGKCIQSLNFKVFNRWGNLVFETHKLDEGWDGTYQGKLQNTAVYVYYLEATFENGKTVTESGNISLIR